MATVSRASWRVPPPIGFRSGSFPPRIQHLDARGAEVGLVAGDDGEAVTDGGGGDQMVHRPTSRGSDRSRFRSNATPASGDARRNSASEGFGRLRRFVKWVTAPFVSSALRLSDRISRDHLLQPEGDSIVISGPHVNNLEGGSRGEQDLVFFALLGEKWWVRLGIRPERIRPAKSTVPPLAPILTSCRRWNTPQG